MSPVGQGIGAGPIRLQNPANKTFKQDAKIPTMDGVKLINLRLQRSTAHRPSASAFLRSGKSEFTAALRWHINRG